MSTDRIILHSAIAPAFIDSVKKALIAGSDTSSPPPTLVSAASKARVQAMISGALSSGAHLIHGSVDNTNGSLNQGDDSGVFMAPVVLGGAKEDMPMWQDEAFASLAACMVVDDDEEAVKIANRGGYGLSASVFTENLRKGFSLAKKLESG